MISVLDHAAVRLAGALDASHSATGRTPRRLAAWASKQIQDPMFQFMISVASGVRITFASNADAVELDAMLTGIELAEMPGPTPRFDLVIDGQTVAAQQSAGGGRWVVRPASGPGPFDVEFRAGERSAIRFDGLGSGMKRIELWLPQSCIVELRDLRVSEGATVEPAPVTARRWVHHGSSISQCSEAEGPTETWPAIAARLAGVDLTSMGFGGQCHLDQCVARTIRDLAADVISVKVGINIINGDTMRERVFAPALHGFLDTVRDGHPATPLLVSTPILYPAGEGHPGPSIVRAGTSAVVERPAELAYGALSIGRIRELIAEVVRQRQKAGDANLHLLDGRELFGEVDIPDLPDGLHPNTAGYRRMGERFAALAFGEGGPLSAKSGKRSIRRRESDR
ncbi:MAG: lipase [Chloroflexi bacterium]|nr:lipase [Chloroflexota bacterium]